MKFISRNRYMATSGMDRSIRIWDVRKLTGPLQDYKVRTSPRNMVFSQTGCLAVAINNVVDVSTDISNTKHNIWLSYNYYKLIKIFTKGL